MVWSLPRTRRFPRFWWTLTTTRRSSRSLPAQVLLFSALSSQPFANNALRGQPPPSGFVYAGLGPDFRVIVRNARKNAQKYYLTYREVQPIDQIVRESAGLMQEYTQSGGVRPFGVSCLIAGYDDDGPQLYQVDPSGSYFGWKATAIGKNYINAKNFLERRYSEDMELDDAVHIALLTLRESYEGEMTESNIEVGIIRSEDRVFRVLSPQEVRDYLDEAN